jgi:hypothetical protein
MANPFGETPLGLASQIMNLAALLLRPFTLRIPPFQRPYTWTTREVGQLIADLRTALDNKSTFYFIGQIVFIRDGRYLDIADGQQRLTTLTMIVAYARDRLPQHAKHFQQLIAAGAGPGGRLQLRPAEADFYHYWVQTPGRMAQLASLTDFTTDSQECLIFAAREIALALDGLDANALDQLIRFIARAATFNVIDADEAGGAATVFETMHNRGKTLSQPDILKGVLLNSGELAASDVQAAARLWEQKEERAGRENFARLLRYIPLLLGAGPIISPGDVGALRETIARRVGVKRFLLEVLPRYCDVHRDIINVAVQAGADTSDVQRRVRCLQLVEREDWEPLAIAFLAARAERGPEKTDSTQRFFLVYERLIAGFVLNVFDERVMAPRIARAFRSIVLEGKPLSAIAADLEITNRMREQLLERVSKSSNRDAMRRYLMLRINAIFGEVLRFRDDAGVEHVLPKTPTQWWLQYFPAEARAYNAYSNMIANYVLVTDRQDDEAAQRTFPEKLDVYFRRGYPVRAITRTLEQAGEWTPVTLEKRQEWLCRQISMEWDLAAKS